MIWAKGKRTRGRSSSFAASIRYISHDTRAETSERVGVFELINLGGDLSSCAGEMQATADAARMLQKRHRLEMGMRPSASGSKFEKPVYALSLSWHPDDVPSPAHMLETARDVLKTLGFEQHQAVIVQHTEKRHAHVHIVVNLIHPETGRMAKLHYDERKLDRWAHSYEIGQNLIRTFRRVRNMPSIQAQEKAALIKRVLAERKKEIVAKHRENEDRRDRQIEEAWADYQKARNDIGDKYHALLEEVWRRRPPAPGRDLRPRGSIYFKRSPLRDVAKAIDPDRRRPLAKVFGQALFRITPDKKISPLMRTFALKREGQDIMLPINNTPDMRRFANAQTPDRRRRAQELKLAKANELATLTLDFETGKNEINERHVAERLEDAKDLATFREQSAVIWQQWRDEYGIEQEERPNWVDRRRESEVQKPETRPELTPEFTAVSLPDHEIER